VGLGLFYLCVPSCPLRLRLFRFRRFRAITAISAIQGPPPPCTST